MTDHITKEWFEKKVRQTDDGSRAALPDLIRNAITGRGVNQVWQRLKEQHPDVLDLVSNVRFPDINGHISKKPTPTVDLEGWLQILPLLPGAAGKKYRKDTAELVVRIWKGDADLGLAIMLRDTDKQRLERAKARMRVGDFNIKTRQTALDNNEKPNLVHDARYRGVYDMTAGMVRNEMELSKNDCPLDYMETGELAIHEATQYMALKAMKAKGGTLQGHTFKAGRQMRNAYVETVGTPPVLRPASETIYMDLNDARAISASHSAGQGSLF